ncbi:MAG: hypothetical protein HOV79_00315 [Hamadaea sp.]|nr:hypothetical protein [Hamadaea sp.]
MITIPTSDLLGIIADVAPFALVDKDMPEWGLVRLEWTSEQLDAYATNGWVAARSSWHPDDLPDRDREDDLFQLWGGDDARWRIDIPVDDAKALLSIYKLPAKETWAQLTVEHVNLHSVRIVRTKDTGHPAITTVIRGGDAEMPDVAKALDTLREDRPTARVAFNAKQLALFDKVRPRGAVAMQLGGEKHSTRVTIGERFVATLLPASAEWVRPASGGERGDG